MVKASLKTTWRHHSIVLASLILFLVQIIVRWPSFFEPYWYGDEGIYLTIGQVLNQGAVLYKDIIDHKTPLIYYLARVESQFAFRVVLLAFMTIASISMFYFLKQVIRQPRLSLLIAIVFAVLTAMPSYEGLIPNGELFVMSFVLASLAIAVRHKDFLAMIRNTPLPVKSKNNWLLVVAGSLLSLAVLTKVPAIFDALAVFFIGWLVLFDQILPWSNRQVHWRTTLVAVIQSWLWLFLGLVLPLAFSFLYFASNNALGEYIDYGWLYSFRYSSEWISTALPTDLLWLTDLSFKASVTISILLGLSLLGSRVSRVLRFALGWLSLAIFASLLSNRPYPHYFLQIAPPLIVLSGLTLSHSVLWFKHRTQHHRNALLIALIALVSGIMLVSGAHLSVGMPRYPTTEYYQRFFAFQLGKLSAYEFRDSFNWLTNDNYHLASELRNDPEATLFIWGTNPILYALTNKQPVSRFTVAFHIIDFQAETETVERLRQDRPTFIVVMKNESPLEGLAGFLRTQYTEHARYDSMVVYRLRDS